LGRFELGGVAVFDVDSDTLKASKDTAFITVGDDEITIEGTRAPEIGAFVVRACNSHDALLTELKALRRRFHAACVHAGNSADVASVACASADAAIAAAEAQS
jgi:hypothetical protein